MHDEALTARASVLLPQFTKFEGFYLAGGTALALQIGHRISVDFDFFYSDALPSGLLQKVKRLFPKSAISLTYSSPEQLNVLIGGVQVTFLYYPYPSIDPFVTYEGVFLASIQEIAAMKAFSIGKRLSYKDYVDWYFLLKEKHVNLKDTIAFSQKKFGNDFNDKLFLGQLVSMEDVPTQKIDFLRETVEAGTIQESLKSKVRAFEL